MIGYLSQLSNYRLSDYKLSDYNITGKLMENTEVYGPVKFEEIVIFMHGMNTRIYKDFCSL